MDALPYALRKRLDPAERYGLRLTLFAVAIILVAVPFGLLLQQVVNSGPMLEVDKGVVEDVHEWVLRQPEWFVTLMHGVSWLGKPILLTLFAGAGALYVLRHNRVRLALFLVVTSTLGGIIDTVVKIAVNRPRPELDEPLAHALGKSFPSGHAMSSTVVYGALLLVFLPALPPRAKRWVTAATVLLVLSIAGSRVMLGVHFLSDIVGGLVLGLAWLLASVAAFRTWRSERGRRTTPVLEGLEPEAAQDLTPSA